MKPEYATINSELIRRCNYFNTGGYSCGNEFAKSMVWGIMAAIKNERGSLLLWGI